MTTSSEPQDGRVGLGGFGGFAPARFQTDDETYGTGEGKEPTKPTKPTLPETKHRDSRRLSSIVPGGFRGGVRVGFAGAATRSGGLGVDALDTFR